MQISFQKNFFALAFAFLIGLFLWLTKSILIPIVFALLFAFVLYPIVKKLVSKGIGLTWSILLTMLSITSVVLGTLVLFSAKLLSMLDQFKDFQGKLSSVMEKGIIFINEEVPFISDISMETIVQSIGELFSTSGFSIVSGTITQTGTILSYVLLTFLYTFLILLYHKRLRKACLSFVKESEQEELSIMLREVQQVGQKYVTGMGFLIIVLGVLNSIGLLIIGLDYAIFFGFFAAVLAIIPYVGTAIGGLIPTLYALLEYDSPWYPISIILVFWFIQTLEGNVLSPKIVGGKLNLNALFAIIALIASAALWGLPGIILALPMAAILKVIFNSFDALKPLSALMENDDSQEDGNLIKKIKSSRLAKIFKK
ncbi:MAG: putative PurR-regulated permease PerM [Marinoscillum sp.]|jgi:predicted PurR-regulated permease PerM